MCLQIITNMEEDYIHTEFDVGNLSVTKIKHLIPAKNQDEPWLASITLEAVKGIFKEIEKLPKEYNGDVCLVKLPPPATLLPREKPVPKAKPPTRWEKFSQRKGITKRRKDKSIWDRDSKSWKPSYGFKSAKNNQEDWLVELPNNADPNENPFAKKKEQKKENVAKNEYQRLRNISDTSKIKVTNMESLDKANKTQLTKSLSAAKVATASMGKFTKNLPKEKTDKRISRKRKFDENIPSSVKTEKENYLKILESINKGKPKLEINEAVQVHIQKKQKKSGNPEGQQKKKKKASKSGKNNSFNRGKQGNKNKFKKK